MSKRIAFETTLEVRDACLCLRVQRAARSLARKFDEALRPLRLTNGQFSLLMSTNRPQPASIAQIAEVLAMDRTTLTAALKPLERDGLVEVSIDDKDRRSRRVVLTDKGHELLSAALPIWRDVHVAIEAELTSETLAGLRNGLLALA